MDSIADMLVGLPDPGKRQFRAFVQHTLNRERHRQLRKRAIARNEIEQEVHNEDSNGQAGM